MMRKVLMVFYVIFGCISFGQDYLFQNTGTQILNVSTPNVANFMRYKESSVDYYSGRANTSIPIYTIKVGNLEYPISLNYASGGIQVNSLSSDVGLGWSLTDTFISRTVVGDADWETFPSVNAPADMTCGMLYPMYEMMKTGFFTRSGPTSHMNKKMDYYPDLFKFYAPNEKSVFYFRNKTTVKELDKKGSKIHWTVNTKKHNYLTSTHPLNGSLENINNNICITDFDSFEITTKNGVRYFFNDKDINHSFQQTTGLHTNFGQIAGTFPRNTSWHVSKIKDQITGEEINFFYEEYSTENSNNITTIFNTSPFYRFEMKYPKNVVNNSCFLPFDNYIDDDAGKYFNRYLAIKRLKKITFRNGSIDFNYNINRDDLSNGKALTSITVKDINHKVVKQVDLEYGYFTSNIQINEFSRRLKLLSIKETGKNKYIFDYYEDDNLPNIGSLYQDFFGYHNQPEVPYNPDNFGTINKKYAKYYFYPNKKEYSILPYTINTDSNHYLLNGTISKEPNELSKTWSLKKIIFPTGGTNEFELESNQFSLWNNNLKGGGVRIKRQILHESPSALPRIINYTYKKDATNSSGYLSNVPYVGHQASMIVDLFSSSPDLSHLSNLENYFFLYTNSKINYDLLNNFFVGYSQIEESEGEKTTIYEYSNEEFSNVQTRTYWTTQGVSYFNTHCMSPSLFLNSALGNDMYIDKSHKRGKLKYVTYYNNGTPVKRLENYYKSMLETELNSDDEFYYTGANIVSIPHTSGDSNSSYGILNESKKSYNSIYNNLVNTKEISYFPNGNVLKENIYNYDYVQNLLTRNTVVAEGTNYPLYEYTENFYPYSYEYLNDPIIQNLNNLNKISTPIKVQTFRGELDLVNQNQTVTNLINSSQVIFKQNSSTSNFVLPSKTQRHSLKTNQYEDEIIFDLYDNKGNLLQFHNSLGIPTTIIYGYNQTLPIAKIEGASYTQVMQAMGLGSNNNSYLGLNISSLSNLDIDANTEQSLLMGLKNFQDNSAFSQFFITTYTYNPLVGVTSITPPSGITEYFIYDTANRLQKTVDINGNIMNEYKYHYKQ